MRRYDTTHHIAYHRLRYEGVQGSKVKRASITLGTNSWTTRSVEVPAQMISAYLAP